MVPPFPGPEGADEKGDGRAGNFVRPFRALSTAAAPTPGKPGAGIVGAFGARKRRPPGHTPLSCRRPFGDAVIANGSMKI